MNPATAHYMASGERGARRQSVGRAAPEQPLSRLLTLPARHSGAMPYVTRRAQVSPRRHLPRLALAVAGVLALGVGWRLTAAEPANAHVAAMEIVPSDFVPEDSGSPLPPPVDPLSAADTPLSVAPAGPSAPARLPARDLQLRHAPPPDPRLQPHAPGRRLRAREGAPVLAAEDGVVTQAWSESGYGNIIRLRHAGGWSTGYAHLSGYAPGVAPGAPVDPWPDHRLRRPHRPRHRTPSALRSQPGRDQARPDDHPRSAAPRPATPTPGAYARLRPALATDLPPA